MQKFTLIILSISLLLLQSCGNNVDTSKNIGEESENKMQETHLQPVEQPQDFITNSSLWEK